MNFHDSFLKNSSLKNYSNEEPIKKGIDKLIPLLAFNKLLNKTDYILTVDKVKEEFPELIQKIDDTTDAIDYTSFIPILIKEMQDIKQYLGIMKEVPIIKEPVAAVENASNIEIEPVIIEREQPKQFIPIYKK